MIIALGQINCTVGDLAGNVEKMIGAAQRAADRGAQLIAFPELSITGYPPRDLLDKQSFIDRTQDALEHLAGRTAQLPISLVCGYVARAAANSGRQVTNSAAVLEGGRVVFRQDKMLLPNYDVFDEQRYFQPADRQSLAILCGERVALTICEDAWNDKQYWSRRLYDRDPVEELADGGAQVLITINASPYHTGKRTLRRDIFATTARQRKLPVVYVNLVGGNDHLVFDGSSFAMNASGEIIGAASSFAEDLVIVDTNEGIEIGGTGIGIGDIAGTHQSSEPSTPAAVSPIPAHVPEHEAVYDALVLGTRDYIRKCGFSRVLIGLSGGIDSSLTAVIAVDAVGRENVVGVGMPGPYSSDHSVRDARDMAECLGIRFELISITPAYEEMLATLTPVFDGAKPGVTEENLQSRLRGVTLMALSNKWGAIVLTTGNKSELAVGYCTLYGDMCGGLAVISDVPKTLVYDLSRVANRRHHGAIPESVFEKPPSAELRPDQKDTDSLPPYEVLDQILKDYVEESKSARLIAEENSLSIDLVRDIINKVDRNEYKRQQAAPGLKVTSKAFGMGRRFPIAQRFSE